MQNKRCSSQFLKFAGEPAYSALSGYHADVPKHKKPAFDGGL
jgi:hypothetical protein